MKNDHYPIPCNLLTEGQAPVPGYVVKLTGVGFLIQFTKPGAFRLGDQLKAEFRVPVTEVKLSEPVTVVKSYLSYVADRDGNKTKAQLIEMHFSALDASRRGAIEQFLQKAEGNNPP